MTVYKTCFNYHQYVFLVRVNRGLKEIHNSQLFKRNQNKKKCFVYAASFCPHSYINSWNIIAVRLVVYEEP